MDFLPEAYRVLQENGKMVIAPLYVDNEYYGIVSPYSETKGLDLGGAQLVWDDCGWPMSTFGASERYYSVEAFNERVVANLNGFKLTVYYVENAHEVSPYIEWPTYYTRFAALLEKSSNSDQD